MSVKVMLINNWQSTVSSLNVQDGRVHYINDLKDNRIAILFQDKENNRRPGFGWVSSIADIGYTDHVSFEEAMEFVNKKLVELNYRFVPDKALSMR